MKKAGMLMWLGVVSAHGFNNLPRTFDHLNATLRSAAILDAAEVTIAFGAGQSSHEAGNLTQAAGLAVANGLSERTALAALTINPARMFGMADELGSIAVDKRANLVIWPGDPLESTTFPSAVLIDGEQMPMVSRQTELRDRYLQIIREGL